MVYASSVRVYDEITGEITSEFGFIYGDTYVDAMNTLVDYYGEEYVDSIEIGVFAPDNFLAFGQYEDEFKEIKKSI